MRGSLYKKLMMDYHPDRVSHLGPELRELAERRAKEFNIAMDYLAKHLPQMS